MKVILGTKLGMTQIHGEDGNVTPVTVVEAEPNVIVQVKTKDKDNYEAVQIGYGTKKEKNIKKPQKGHFKGLGNFAVLKEFRVDSKSGLSAEASAKAGDKIDVTVFEPGDEVRVTGITKGKGFQGVMKRHGFHGAPASHGHRSVKRHAGSIGQRFPQHTLKGMKMAGHMGNVKFTTRGLKVVSIDPENNLIVIKGAVPGNNGRVVIIQAQK